MEKENAKEEALFRKFIANRCSREEIGQVFSRLNTSASAKALMQALIAEELRQTARSGQVIDPEVSENLRKKILERIEIPPPASKRIYRPAYWKVREWKVAAALAGLLVLAMTGYRYYIKNSLATHSTLYGEIARIILPDSSTVVLNGNSALRYPRDWKDGPREVWIEGEAFFSVKHTHDDRKFIVHSSRQLDVEVLGTEFNVYDRTDLTRVVLNTGKVKLNIKKKDAAAREVDMRPGELVELHENLEYEKREVDPGDYNSWINGRIVLDNTSFREIVILLEETYGLSVTVPDTVLYRERFSGTVPGDNAEALLRALALSFDLDIKAEGNQVIFKTKVTRVK